MRRFLRDRSFWFVLLTTAALTAVYYVYFASQYFTGNIVMGGDTQLVWSLSYLAAYSLAHYGEFLWWDPTTLNGWPAYVNVISGWFSYLSPYALFSFVLAFLGSSFVNLSINGFLVFQKTLYYFVLNILAVTLLAREVIKNDAARLLPPLIFTLSAIQFHGFRDGTFYEALPGPLFFVFSLVYFNNRRTVGAFKVLLVFTALLLASLNFMFLQTSLWWTSLFTFFLVILYPGIVPTVLRLFPTMWRQPKERYTVLLGMLLLATAALASYLPIHSNLGESVRVSGVGRINYDIGAAGDWPGLSAIYSNAVWTNFLYWAPFDVIHDVFLRFDRGGGADHRYIGLVTLPLLFAVAIRSLRNRYVWVFLLTTFASTAFITYTSRNLLIIALTATADFMRNIKTISDTLPRDGPMILLIILAGMGLDALLLDRGEGDLTRSEGRSLDGLLKLSYYALLALATISIVLSLVPMGSSTDPNLSAVRAAFWGSPLMGKLKESLAHIGIYLFVFTFLSLLCLMIRDERFRRPLGIVLLAVTFMDLTISSTAYWQRGLVWFANQGPHALPNPERIGPIDSALETWPGSYGGLIHNPVAGPYMGLKSWLVLATRQEWQPVLENWNPSIRTIKAYPDFRFYTKASYLPFEKIREIDSLPLSSRRLDGTFYLHDKSVADSADGAAQKLDAKWQIVDFTLNRVQVRVSMPQKGFMVFLDNYDRFWRARVDAAAVPIYRANFTFKAIALPAGDHTVTWTYDPRIIKFSWLAFYLVLAAFTWFLTGWRPWWTLATILLILAIFIGGPRLLPGHRVRPTTDDSTQGPKFLAGDRVARVDGRLLVPSKGGKQFPVVGGSVLSPVPGGSEGLAGSVEGAHLDVNGMTRIAGWAIDDVATMPAQKVVITIGDRVWTSGRPSDDRTDIVGGLGPGYRRSGFVLFARGADASDLKHLRAYALRQDGTLRELLYAPGVPHEGN